MINHESEDVILTRIIEGYSADISELADLPQACEDPENFTSSEVGNENDVIEETYMTPVPGFVASVKRYESFDLAFEELKHYTDSLCINATITSSNWEENEGEERKRKYGVIRCHKSRDSATAAYVVKGTPGSRNGRSARCSCPFKWTINRKQSKDKNGKLIQYFSVKAINNEHNHVPNKKTFAALSVQRQLTVDQLKYVEEMMVYGTTPSDMVTALSERYPGQVFVNKTIYQARLQIRKKILNNRTPVQYLVDKLASTKCYRYEMDFDNEGRLNKLFFAHESSIELYNRYPDVLVMDSTYKTNKFGMPLLEIGGMTNSNATFLLGCIFLSSEEKYSYEWALKQVDRFCFQNNTPSVIVTDRENALINAIAKVIPGSKHFLCRWHISNNVFTHINECFRSLSKDDMEMILNGWKNLVQESFTSEEFNENLVKFKAILPASGKIAFEQYLEKEWVPLKEKFVEAWTKKYRHFNSTSTSRIEGMHATMKRYIKVSTNDIDIVVGRLDKAITAQVNRICQDNADSQDKSLSSISKIAFFLPVVKKISTFALTKVFRQYAMAKMSVKYPSVQRFSIGECKESFSSKMGIPCSHEVKSMLLSKKQLMKEDFDSQWWLSKPVESVNNCSQLTDSIIFESDEMFASQEVINEMSTPACSSQENQMLSPEDLNIIQQRYNNALPHRQAAIRAFFKNLANNELPYELSDPNEARRKGRKRKAGLSAQNRNISSTQRDSSAFEFVVAEQQARSKKCGNCSGVGHNRRSCSVSQQELSQESRDLHLNMPQRKRPRAENSLNSSATCLSDNNLFVEDSNNGGVAVVTRTTITDGEELLDCPICRQLLLSDERFEGNLVELNVLREAMAERYSVLANKKKELASGKGKRTNKKYEELIEGLDAEFCRQHNLFELNVELKNNDCHELALKLPREIKSSVLKTRIISIIQDKDFKQLINTGNSYFRGAARSMFDALQNEGYEKRFAGMAFANSHAGLYSPGYYGHDGAEVIFRTAMQHLTRRFLLTTPWAEEVVQESDYLLFLRHTMLPEIGYRLIEQDLLNMGYEIKGSEIIMAEKIMMITANIIYNKSHIKVDEDN